MIDLLDVEISYPKKTILKEFSFSVKEGEHVALSGPSGCGKTSVLNLIAGIKKAEKGMVKISGSVSYMFQEPRLFPWLTAAENINLVLSDSKETLAEAENWLRKIGMEGDIAKYPEELSGGMQQRVSLARTLCVDRDIYLLDEPLKALDAERKKLMVDLIKQRLKDKTMILVTHDPAEAENLCDRICRIAPKLQ